MATAEEWRRAYAKQARVDLASYELLIKARTLPACQHLHFLQMACEKACKAYLCGHGVDPTILQRSHAFIARPLATIARRKLKQFGYRHQSWALSALRALARRIELLAPAADAGGTVPANCEYPWIDASGRVRTPAEHDFGLDPRRERAGLILMKLLHSLLDDLLAETKEHR